MKISGIVCEYNPMHSGHVYHINKTIENGATHIVCAMSGNYVQRGEPAYIDKWTRARVAVKNGADLVVEIPTPWCLESAEKYALGGVSVLDMCGCNAISCGIESGNSECIIEILSLFDNESFIEEIKQAMKKGDNYPVAVSTISEKYIGKNASEFLSQPNNVLAFEYAKAIKKINRDIQLETVARFGNGYNTNDINGSHLSASAIRNADCQVDEIYFASSMLDEINKCKSKGILPVSFSNASVSVLSSLSVMSQQELYRYNTELMANRIYKALAESDSLDSLMNLIKNKSVTMSQVKRSILKSYLGIPKDMSSGTVPYLKILAIGKKGKDILAAINPDVQIISGYSSTKEKSSNIQELYELECKCSTLYGSFASKFCYQNSEKTNKIYVI